MSFHSVEIQRPDSSLIGTVCRVRTDGSGSYLAFASSQWTLFLVEKEGKTSRHL